MKKSTALRILSLFAFVLAAMAMQRASAQTTTYATYSIKICDETGNNIPYQVYTSNPNSYTTGFSTYFYYLPSYINKNSCSCSLYSTYPSTQQAYIEASFPRAGSGTNQYVEVREITPSGTSVYCLQLEPVISKNLRHVVSANAIAVEIYRKNGTCVPTP